MKIYVVPLFLLALLLQTVSVHVAQANNIDGRLELGTRLAHRVLTDNDSGHKWGRYGSGTFLGTIYALDEKQDYLPTQIYARYFFNYYLGVELAYEDFKAETVATSVFKNTVKTDGDVELFGPALTLIGRYPNNSPFTPYAGFGLAFLFADFKEDPEWHYSPDRGRKREMDLDDVIATLFTVGVSWEFASHWSMEISSKYVGNADVDAVFNGYTYGVHDTEQSGYFPMDHWAFQLGITYAF